MAQRTGFSEGRSDWWWRRCCSRPISCSGWIRHSDPKLKPWATANRLSYSLWDTMPDAALFAAAERGELCHAGGCGKGGAADAGRSAGARSAERIRQPVAALRPPADCEQGPPQVSRCSRAKRPIAMTDRGALFVSDLVWNDHNFMTLFTADYGYRQPGSGAHLWRDGPGERLRPGAVPGGIGAGGDSGTGLFLALTAKPDDSSPTARGLFVREQFLCQHVPDPPPGVNTNLPPVTEAKPQTNRDRMSEHATNPTCATCHKLMDPIGFGLEKFDAIGRAARASSAGVSQDRRRKTKASRHKPVRRPSTLRDRYAARMWPAFRIRSSLRRRNWARFWRRARSARNAL